MVEKIRSSMVSSVKEYFRSLSGWNRDVCEDPHKLILECAPDLETGIKWSRPVYQQNEMVCYLQAHSHHVRFGFWRGAELDDPEGFLEGSGKSMRHVKIGRDQESPARALQKVLLEAIDLDREDGS